MTPSLYYLSSPLIGWARPASCNDAVSSGLDGQVGLGLRHVGSGSGASRDSLCGTSQELRLGSAGAGSGCGSARDCFLRARAGFGFSPRFLGTGGVRESPPPFGEEEEEEEEVC